MPGDNNMKNWVILLSTLALSITAFASPAFSLSNKQDLSILGSALKTQKNLHTHQKEDVFIVYGGEDISRNINAINSTAFA